MFRLVKHYIKFTIKTRDRWRHHFNLNNFWFGAKNLTLIYDLSH